MITHNNQLPICIYHANCADGFAAAMVVHNHFDGEVELCPAHYNQPAPDVTGREVYIVDFSYKREVLLEMAEQANSIVVLDHHKTAQAELEGLDFCHFDMDRSGAMLAWNYFNPNRKDAAAPLIIRYVQDRDLWKWALVDSKAFSAGLRMLPMTVADWQPFFNSLYDAMQLETYCFKTGATILAYQDQEIKRAIHPDKVCMVEIAGYVVPCVNTTTLISEVCGELAKGHPFAATFFVKGDELVYSLRVTDGDVDVGEIARSLGGGGHAKAAGFTRPFNEPMPRAGE